MPTILAIFVCKNITIWSQELPSASWPSKFQDFPGPRLFPRTFQFSKKNSGTFHDFPRGEPWNCVRFFPIYWRRNGIQPKLLSVGKHSTALNVSNTNNTINKSVTARHVNWPVCYTAWYPYMEKPTSKPLVGFQSQQIPSTGERKQHQLVLCHAEHHWQHGMQ